MVLSTCHRLEFYVVTADVEGARAQVAAWCGVSPGALAPSADQAWAVRTGVDAATHLCRVAAGLESLIVGEAEIAGQVRRAAALARESGTLGPYLERVIAGALRASGRARSETRIGNGVLSAASAGVMLATNALGSFANRHVLVVGAGQAARTVLGRLERQPTGAVSVASRSARHAREAADPLGASVWTLDEVPRRLGEVDVVIAAIQAGRVPRPREGHGGSQHAARDRSGRGHAAGCDAVFRG
jgi:glutamyl-tRNA reductase